MGGFEKFENIEPQVTTQLAAASITAVDTIAVSVVLLLLIKYTIGLRISDSQEIAGIEMAEHSERGYNM